MKFIDTEEQYNELCTELHNADVFVTIIFSETFIHYTQNSISCICITNLKNQQSYTLFINHVDAIYKCDMLRVSKLFESFNNIYITNKRFIYNILDYHKDNIIDLVLASNIYTYPTDVIDLDETSECMLYYRLYPEIKNVHNIVPVTIFNKYHKIHYDFFIELIKQIDIDAFKKYNILLTPLIELEFNGLYVNENKFRSKFETTKVYDSYVYTEYNITTSTGRPSNRYDSVNYAALNKTDLTRKCFVSRFQYDGLLMSIDYEAYHLNLIAELVGYTFNQGESVHTQLGRLYFPGTIHLTPEQYDESKKISFRILYGGVPKSYMKYDFFKLIAEYIQNMWQEFNTNGYVMSPIFKRKFHKKHLNDMTPQKLFNYIIQNFETERNMVVLTKLHELLRVHDSKCVLYTYDSFLFDIHIPTTNKQLLVDIYNIITLNNKFPVSVSVGKNYHDLKEINTDKFLK